MSHSCLWFTSMSRVFFFFINLGLALFASLIFRDELKKPSGRDQMSEHKSLNQSVCFSCRQMFEDSGHKDDTSVICLNMCSSFSLFYSSMSLFDKEWPPGILWKIVNWFINISPSCFAWIMGVCWQVFYLSQGYLPHNVKLDTSHCSEL